MKREALVSTQLKIQRVRVNFLLVRILAMGVVSDRILDQNMSFSHLQQTCWSIKSTSISNLTSKSCTLGLEFITLSRGISLLDKIIDNEFEVSSQLNLIQYNLKGV